MYAIGGSANPTINSQGNVFVAADSNFTKEVTSHSPILAIDKTPRSCCDIGLSGVYESELTC